MTQEVIELTPNEYDVLVDALKLLSGYCTDLEIVDNRICVRSDDSVIYYDFRLPLTKSLSLRFLNIKNVVSVMDFMKAENIQLVFDDDYFTFVFDNKHELQFKKDVIVFTNVYSADAIDKINANIFDTLVFKLPLKEAEQIRKFSAPTYCDLDKKQITIEIQGMQFTPKFGFEIEKSFDNDDTPYTEFEFLHQSIVKFSDDITVNVNFIPAHANKQHRDLVVYRLDSNVSLGNHLVPISVYAISHYPPERQNDLIS